MVSVDSSIHILLCQLEAVHVSDLTRNNAAVLLLLKRTILSDQLQYLELFPNFRLLFEQSLTHLLHFLLLLSFLTWIYGIFLLYDWRLSNRPLISFVAWLANRFNIRFGSIFGFFLFWGCLLCNLLDTSGYACILWRICTSFYGSWMADVLTLWVVPWHLLLCGLLNEYLTIFHSLVRIYFVWRCAAALASLLNPDGLGRNRGNRIEESVCWD